MTRFWHPVADMHAVSPVRRAADRASGRGTGCGTRTAGGTSTPAPASGTATSATAVTRSSTRSRPRCGRLPSYSSYGDLSTPRHDGASPSGSPRSRRWTTPAIFFTSGGAESIETAAKLARRYWSLLGDTERTVVISRERAYHGMAAYGTSLAGTDVVQGRRSGRSSATRCRSRGTRPRRSPRRSTRSGRGASPRSSASRSSARVASCCRRPATSRRRAASAASATSCSSPTR